MRTPRLFTAAAAAMISFLAACEIDTRTVGQQIPQVVVHAVLNPSATEQEILVEQSLVGTAGVRNARRFDPRDPINGGGGVPISRADVRISGPDGTLQAFEQPGAPGGFGAGLYLLPTGRGQPQIRPGSRYLLTVRTLSGAVVTGHTIVPSDTPVLATTNVQFDRDRDTVRLQWNVSPNARTFGLRVETPFGPFLLFTDSTHIVLAGGLRNLFAEQLQRTFVPGFRQNVTVVAADTNFFDYYRSRNDPFTGSGLINRLHGGVGLFGSTVIVAQRTIDVTQSLRDSSLEGSYELVQSPVSRPVVDNFRLYVETAGEPAALSGWYSRSGARDGIVGTRSNGRIVLHFLRNQDARDTTAAFIGARVADSLVGNYAGITGRVVFKRRP